jgi:malate synthase
VSLNEVFVLTLNAGTEEYVLLRSNDYRALSYCAAWISGNGCVPINFLMVRFDIHL